MYKVYDLTKLKQENNQDLVKIMQQPDYVEKEVVDNLEGSSLVNNNTLLCCRKLRTFFQGKSERVVSRKFWNFWDLEKDESVREALPPRIEGVFFEKSQAKDFPEHFYVMRKTRENNVEIEADKSSGNKSLNKSVNSAGRKRKNMYEDHLYHQFFKFNFAETGENGHPRTLVMQTQDPNRVDEESKKEKKKNKKEAKGKNKNKDEAAEGDKPEDENKEAN